LGTRRHAIDADCAQLINRVRALRLWQLSITQTASAGQGKAAMADVVEGSSNVLEVVDAETHRIKAELVRRVAALLAERGLTQAAASSLIGLSQPDISRMLQGRLDRISLERLMRCLVALGKSVTIDVGPPAKQTRPSIRMTVR
jgi:predicted XRE-type DNA-binding protein